MTYSLKEQKSLKLIYHKNIKFSNFRNSLQINRWLQPVTNNQKINETGIQHQG
jgi:hypothetical protein